MQILKHKTHIDFIGKRKPALFISSVLNLAILVGIAIFGFNFGVDFAGGTMVEVKFPNSINDTQVREAALKGGLHDPMVQQVGATAENTFLLRMGGVTQLTAESAAKAEEAVKALDPAVKFRPDIDDGMIRIRTSKEIPADQLKGTIESAAAIGVKEVRALGKADQAGAFDYQVVAAGMADRVTAALRVGLEQKDFEVRRVDYVGPQVG
ncbi:MAG: protein translocase subunit SecF, partial [Myxococcaceae bacterium]